MDLVILGRNYSYKSLWIRVKVRLDLFKVIYGMNNPSYSFLSARFILEISLISVHFRYTCPASKIRFTME